MSVEKLKEFSYAHVEKPACVIGIMKYTLILSSKVQDIFILVWIHECKMQKVIHKSGPTIEIKRFGKIQK